jgi:AcrR family transcriptional regulator
MEIMEFLARHAIKATRVEHPAVMTVEESERLVPPLPGAKTKNLFLRDKKGSRHFLVSVPHDRAVVDRPSVPTASARQRCGPSPNVVDIQIPAVLDTVGMRTRLSRVAQVERNGERLLQAARRVFLAKGYAGATLDAIAEEAGFSKGVVYSQFDGKADLFLALLDRRIRERAEQNERIVAEVAGRGGIGALIELAERIFRGEPEWSLLSSSSGCTRLATRGSTSVTRRRITVRSSGSAKRSPRSMSAPGSSPRSQLGRWPSSSSRSARDSSLSASTTATRFVMSAWRD